MTLVYHSEINIFPLYTDILRYQKKVIMGLCRPVTQPDAMGLSPSSDQGLYTLV